MDKFIDEGIKGKYITPAQVNIGLKSFLYSLNKPAEITYSEKGKDGSVKEIKSDAYSVIKDIFRNFKEAPEGNLDGPDPGKKLGDFNSADSEDEKDGGNYVEEVKLTNEKLRDAKKSGEPIPYSEALSEARAELKEKNK